MKKYIFLLLLVNNISFGQDGNLDLTFNSSLNTVASVEVIKEQNDGKILIGGLVNSNLKRLNNDGSIDTAFLGSNIINGRVFNIDIQNDNKILIGGDFYNKIIRLNQDGSIDSTFNTIIPNGYINNLKYLTNGKIMICGFFNQVNGYTRTGIARLNSDGSLDTSFDLNLPPDTRVIDFDFQSDGKIILSGYRNLGFNQVDILNFDRYDLNNLKDTTFFAYSTNGYIYDIEISGDDKIMICGSFTTYASIQTNALARLNSNGTIDYSFHSYNYPQGGVNYSILNVKCLYEGRYLINGSFPSYDNQSNAYLTRINNDGTTDNTFNVGIALNNFVLESEIQNDGKILVGGLFTTFNNVSNIGIVRIENSILSTNDSKEISEFKIFPNPVKSILNIEQINPTEVISINIFNAIGQLVFLIPNPKVIKSIDVANLETGNYFIKINTDKGFSNMKFMKL